jgi:hypothetical protein
MTPSRSTGYSPFFSYKFGYAAVRPRCTIIGKCQRQKCQLQSKIKARPSSDDRQKRHLGGSPARSPDSTHQPHGPPSFSSPATVAARSITYTHSSEHAVWVTEKMGSHNPARKLISRSSSRQFPAHRGELSLFRCFLNLSGVKSRYRSVEPNPT